MKVSSFAAKILVVAAFVMTIGPRQSLAATVDNYCIIPSFMKVIQPPNLLLMIDNSSSMYDLAYADEGQKSSTGTVTRQPYYCYDQTYKSNYCSGNSSQSCGSNSDCKFCSNNPTTSCTADADCGTGNTCGTSCLNLYAGYFASTHYYEYDFTNKYFYEVSSFPSSASCTNYVANTLCVGFDSATPAQVNRFAVKGNYLNWLAASKFDVEKKVLTGGKYDGSALIAESRGCVGQAFIKEALQADFVNFSSSETNPNAKLGVVFAVKGPADSVNPSAPSRGGQTSIEIYSGNYNNEACQNAVDVYLASASTSQTVVSDAISQCINYTTSNSSYCQGDTTMACTTDANCLVVTAGVKGTCRGKSSISCYYDTDCYSGNSYKGPCDGETVGTTVDKGPCIVPGQSAEVKTKIAYSETIQSCWSYLRNGTMSTGDFNRLTTGGKCNDVYAGAGVCSGDTSKACTTDTNCSSGGWGTCTKGPAGILPGNPAQVCSNEYLGAYYTGSSPSWGNTWANNDAGMIDAVKRFCNASQPTVIDPTDSAATTSNYETVPAILGGIGVEGQLGQSRGKLTTKLHLSSAPTGLVQEFGERIRIGAMQFNFTGSASEVPPATGATLTAPKVCSNDATRLCILDVDCGSGTCGSATAGTANLDGGKIIYPIGRGKCSTTTTTVCSTDGNCPSGERCNVDSVGQHTTVDSLINSLDSIKANAWTPFAEAFYDAIGYFARTSSGTSRTDLRINSGDFDQSLNPSQYRCQQNFILLISDGSSTADRNPNVTSLASLYSTAAGKTSGWDSTCPNYAGSKNLPILSWLAKNRKISTFSTSTASTDVPVNARDQITTYVVYNGGSNGLSGECNSLQLLTDTATNGGTTIKVANNPQQLEEDIRNIFDEIEKQSASGTAASILSNSQGSGANILQAVFHPRKRFSLETEATWVGEIHNLWYYIDPRLGNSTIREDTDFATTTPIHFLNLLSDYVVSFYFDPITSQTMVRRYQDTDGNGSGDSLVGGAMSPDDLSAIWRAGKALWARDVTVSGQERTIKTTIDDSTLINFSTANAVTLQPYLQAGSEAEAEKIINYVNGVDYLSDTTIRPRTVSIGGSSGVWKLGDIVSSTPRLLSTGQLNLYDSVYGDASYQSFINSNNYKSRGMVFAGANDGMMHAFTLGQLEFPATGSDKAKLTGSNLGRERWAFIPKNALPYLTYLKDKIYEEKHVFFVDGPTVLFDASIGVTSTTCATDYSTCTKDSVVVTSTNNLDSAKNPWRTIMIGSMGMGGATRKSCTGVSSCVETPLTDPVDGTKGLGYSSYFALDITDPTSPELLWEFSNEGLGYATTGPAIIRIGDRDKNGKWFVVLGSGPTGPIQNTQFLAESNQPLKLFVLDLKSGSLLRTIDTSTTYNDLDNAYSGLLVGAQIDTDRWKQSSNGYYKDDALHFGYVKKAGTAAAPTWNAGGVMRLMTKESSNPANWEVSKVIDDIGPVTTGIARLVDRNNKRLWLYFGGGRYYYKTDDNGTRRSIFGVKEPCYTTDNDLDQTCTTTLSKDDDLTDQSSDSAADSLSSSKDKGWFIDLDEADSSFGAERIVTDPVALTNGTVFFTSFKPTPDVCGYGGSSLVWVTKFDTGAAPPSKVMVGKILLQLSTGTFKEIQISDAFTAKGGRRTNESLTGKPPGDPPPVITNAGNKPLKKVLHIQER